MAIGGSVGATRFGTDQEVLASEAVVTRAMSMSASLVQVRTGATLTLTIADDTDLGVDGAYFAYDTKDPNSVGLFDVTAGGATTSFGAGLPMLPPRWSARPELAHRFGSLSLRAYYQYTDRVDGGAGHTAGGKVQLGVGSIKLYATGSYRADVFTTGNAQTWTGGLGLMAKL
jgi:hypothetical protein